VYYKLILLSVILVLMTACSNDPEPNEFTQMRLDMQKRHSQVFANSVEKLEKRKRVYKKKSTKNVFKVNLEEAFRLQKEAERVKWLEAGINAEEIADWKALELSAKDAARWKKTDLSYNTISVLINEDVSPSEAVAFMHKSFTKHPKAFSQFSQPLFEFQNSCKVILGSNNQMLMSIRKKCHAYVQSLNESTLAGHLADEYLDNDLSLEYVSKLREVDRTKASIQKEMLKQSKASMMYTDKKSFALLFPILEVSPSQEEMFFIRKHNLQLQDTKRYKSHEYYEFWINKDKNEEKVRLAAIQQQQALSRVKKLRKKAREERKKLIAYNEMVASECGETVTSTPSTGEKVHVEGKILHVIGNQSSNIFAYVVKNSEDDKNYLIRDPKPKKVRTVNEEVSWVALTVGRVVNVTLDDEGTASYSHYGEKGKEFYPMLKFVSPCLYKRKILTKK